jgi:hypothetical protein
LQKGKAEDARYMRMCRDDDSLIITKIGDGKSKMFALQLVEFYQKKFMGLGTY